MDIKRYWEPVFEPDHTKSLEQFVDDIDNAMQDSIKKHKISDVACNLKNEHDNAFLGFNYIVAAQILALFKSLAYGSTPDNPCPTGEVNRVVKGVILHPYTKK